ncbi:hypothetical protein AKO1_004102 [Acrasis kona]|uniref:Uncharacterized protein n=1 Tax=Acrasis kona TaxID=1008807 RepID=A0AAW2ZAC5_9EUKA
MSRTFFNDDKDPIIHKKKENLTKIRRRTLSDFFSTYFYLEKDGHLMKLYIFTKNTWLPYTEGDIVDYMIECRDRNHITNLQINSTLSLLSIWLYKITKSLLVHSPHDIQYANKLFDFKSTVCEIVPIKKSQNESNATEFVSVYYPLFLASNASEVSNMGTIPSGFVESLSGTSPSSTAIRDNHVHGADTGATLNHTLNPVELLKRAVQLLNETVVAICNKQGVVVSVKSNLLVNLLTLREAGNDCKLVGPFEVFNKDVCDVVRGSQSVHYKKLDFDQNYYLDGDDKLHLTLGALDQKSKNSSSIKSPSFGNKRAKPKKADDDPVKNYYKKRVFAEHINDNYLADRPSDEVPESLLIANKPVESMGNEWEHISVNKK